MCQLLKIKYIVLIFALLLLNLLWNSECLKFLQIHMPIRWQTKYNVLNGYFSLACFGGTVGRQDNRGLLNLGRYKSEKEYREH